MKNALLIPEGKFNIVVIINNYTFVSDYESIFCLYLGSGVTFITSMQQYVKGLSHGSWKMHITSSHMPGLEPATSVWGVTWATALCFLFLWNSSCCMTSTWEEIKMGRPGFVMSQIPADLIGSLTDKC